MPIPIPLPLPIPLAAQLKLITGTSKALNDAVASVATRRLLLPLSFNESPLKVAAGIWDANEPSYYKNESGTAPISRLVDNHPDIELSVLLPALVNCLQTATSILVNLNVTKDIVAYLDFPADDVQGAWKDAKPKLTTAKMSLFDEHGKKSLEVVSVSLSEVSTNGDNSVQATPTYDDA